MDDLRQQHGNHTWDIVVEYVKCPYCHLILENREKYENRLGIYQKDLLCERCHHSFTIEKKKKDQFGPLLGDDLTAT